MVKEHKDLFHEHDDMEEGDFDPDVYSDEGLEELEESDEIDELEEGFMDGYSHGSELVNCSECGKTLIGDKFIEEEFDGKVFRFCGKLCAMRYEEKH